MKRNVSNTGAPCVYLSCVILQAIATYGLPIATAISKAQFVGIAMVLFTLCKQCVGGIMYTLYPAHGVVLVICIICMTQCGLNHIVLMP